jgi:hypothetical protein
MRISSVRIGHEPRVHSQIMAYAARASAALGGPIELVYVRVGSMSPAQRGYRTRSARARVRMAGVAKGRREQRSRERKREYESERERDGGLECRFGQLAISTELHITRSRIQACAVLGVSGRERP